MHLYELADEFQMTSGDALDVCDRVGIHAASGGDEVTPDDVERFRQAVAQGAAQPAVAPPVAPMPAAPMGMTPMPPPPANALQPPPPPPPLMASAAAGADASAGWAAPDAGDQVSGWAAPFAAPLTTPPAAGLYPHQTAPAIPPAPTAHPQVAAYPQAGAPPAAGPMGVTPADLARLSEARSRANSVVMSGIGLLALAVVITGGTMILAPGGFFVVSIGTFIVGVRRISAGRQAQTRVRVAERQLGIRSGGR